jgi:hypothetical protein
MLLAFLSEGLLVAVPARFMHDSDVADRVFIRTSVQSLFVQAAHEHEA